MGEVHAGACSCAGPSLILVPPLIELLADANPTSREKRPVRSGAWVGARPALHLRLLHEQPSTAAIDAVIAIADEECLIIIGRMRGPYPISPSPQSGRSKILACPRPDDCSALGDSRAVATSIELTGSPHAIAILEGRDRCLGTNSHPSEAAAETSTSLPRQAHESAALSPRILRCAISLSPVMSRRNSSTAPGKIASQCG